MKSKRKPSNKRKSSFAKTVHNTQNITPDQETPKSTPEQVLPVTKNSNHPSWYGEPNDPLNKSLGLLNFSNFIGTNNQLEYQTVSIDQGMSNITYRDKWIGNRFPGIMTHHYSQTFGSLASLGNDAGEMARMIYANIRRVISGRRTYDANTVLQYILAVGSFQATFAELERALAAVRSRNVVNKYFGERLVEALGFDYDDIVTNYNAYIGRMNFLVIKARSLVLPKGIKLFEKWYWLASSVFLDKPHEKAGLIAFIPQGFWTFGKLTQHFTNNKEFDDFNKSLKAFGFPNSKIGLYDTVDAPNVVPDRDVAPFGMIYNTYDSFLIPEGTSKTRFSKILNALETVAHTYTDNHDFNLVAADLLKTYGDDSHRLTEFQAGKELEIEYNPGIIAATKNITYAPFRPMAIVEFPNLSWKTQANLNAMVYIMEAFYALPALWVPDFEPRPKFPAFWNPKVSYIFSPLEALDARDAMSVSKWTLRFRATNTYNEGNVILMRRDLPGKILSGAGLEIQAMGTEIIHYSVIYGIEDAYDGVVPNEGTVKVHSADNITTYGLRPYLWGYSNVVELPRLEQSIRTDDFTIRRSLDYLIIHGMFAEFLALSAAWDSSPTLALVKPGGTFSAPVVEGNHVVYVDDLMVVNPWPHYNLMDSNTLARHHEVALAHLLGITKWGSNTINTEQSHEGSPLGTSAFKNGS